MHRYLLRRSLLAIPTLLATSIILFGLLHLAPGGPVAIYAGPDAGPEDLVRIARLLGTDQPLPLQYVKWIGGMVSGDWGRSFRYREPVAVVLGGRLPNTLQLMLAALILALVLAVPFGVIAAVSRRRWVQHQASLASMLGVSIPTFWLGMMVLLVFSVKLRWLPSGGMAAIGVGFTLTNRLHHLIGPALVLSTLYIAAWSRYVRSSLLEVIHQDYIRTGRAKGLSEHRIIFRHALRNALLPLVTLIGLQAPTLVGGAIITETVFAWPGMGRLLAESLTSRDYPVLMASFMIMAALTVVGNLLADLAYGWIDPRIRLG